MTMDELMQMQRARPFRRYRLNLADGRRLTVEHPDFVARSPAGRTVVVYQPNARLEVVDLLLVVGLEVLGGGRRRKRAG
ncbi:MAG: hypothetical protein HY763_14000 [Planctomycetes bacterium]|nr:hypothetical protein [Planctomycetota bacterium]